MSYDSVADVGHQPITDIVQTTNDVTLNEESTLDRLPSDAVVLDQQTESNSTDNEATINDYDWNLMKKRMFNHKRKKAREARLHGDGYTGYRRSKTERLRKMPNERKNV